MVSVGIFKILTTRRMKRSCDDHAKRRCFTAFRKKGKYSIKRNMLLYVNKLVQKIMNGGTLIVKRPNWFDDVKAIAAYEGSSHTSKTQTKMKPISVPEFDVNAPVCGFQLKKRLSIHLRTVNILGDNEVSRSSACIPPSPVCGGDPEL